MRDILHYNANTPPGTPASLAEEFRRLDAALRDLTDFAPRAATREPTKGRDGMIRLSRAPWRPVLSQTVDRWVYFDGATNKWAYLTP